MKLALSITILEATQPLYLLTQTEILYVAPSEATQNSSFIGLQQHRIPMGENVRI
jgi:hypothetical protein